MAIIVTAQLDQTSFERFDALRRTHFPPHLNFLSAHLTMFHNLSDDQADRIAAAHLPTVFPVQFDSVRFLGRGVAVWIVSTELMKLRTDLKAAAAGPFTRQDDQP